jgi:hypothetical protein
MYILDALKYKAKQLKRKLDPPAPVSKVIRHDVHFIPIGPLAKLELYWKLEALGTGPAIILHVLDQYVMRFDCFGEKAGHAHLYLIEPERHCESRLFLPEKTVEVQIERALFELSTNLDYWMSRHRHPSVRKTRLSSATVAEAIAQARDIMHAHNRTAQTENLFGVGEKA